MLPQLAGLDSAGHQADRGVMDRTATIRASVRDVELTLLISIILVILVVFVFLRACGPRSFPASPFRFR